MSAEYVRRSAGGCADRLPEGGDRADDAFVETEGGHVGERGDLVDDDAQPGVVVAGASHDGAGISGCVTSALQAVTTLTERPTR